MERTLQSKGLGAIISQTFGVYGRGFLKLIAIVAIVEAILYVAGWLWGVSILTTGGSPVFAIIGALIVLVLSVIAYLWMQGALIHIISGLNLRLESGIGHAMRTAWRRLARMIGAVLLLFLIGAAFYAVSFLFMMIPFLGIIAAIILVPIGVYLAVRWAFVLQAVVIEGTGPGRALSRSSELVQDNWWRVFGILLVLGIIAGVIGLALSWALAFVPYAGPIIASIISTPIAIIGYTLLYYDLRAREAQCSIDNAAAELGIYVSDTPS